MYTISSAVHQASSALVSRTHTFFTTYLLMLLYSLLVYAFLARSRSFLCNCTNIFPSPYYPPLSHSSAHLLGVVVAKSNAVENSTDARGHGVVQLDGSIFALERSENNVLACHLVERVAIGGCLDRVGRWAQKNEESLFGSAGREGAGRKNG